MRYNQLSGLDFIKKHLDATVQAGRIAHAQLFVGPAGSGVLPLAVAYARQIICSNGRENCDLQMDKLVHPDLHFTYPVANVSKTDSDTGRAKAESDDFAMMWREFLLENPYGNFADWFQKACIEKKSAEIKVSEAQAIMKKLSLKSYEGGYKVLIVWGADRMNTAAANKLLKLIEEPPPKTAIILVAEQEDRIINTIKSRCQILHIPKLSAEQIAEALIHSDNVSEAAAKSIARRSDGDYNKALKFLDNSDEDSQFKEWAIQWVRTAFQAKTKRDAVARLLDWANVIAGLNRETQKRFLLYTLEFFRQAMLSNYGAESAVYFEGTRDFDLNKLAPFITGNRMQSIQKELESAIYHIDRNANGKVVLSDMSISMTRILHA
jgi:DNA polymerase-3 subunit delta'